MSPVFLNRWEGRVRLAEPAWLVVLVLVGVPWLGERARPRVLWPSLGGFARGPRGLAGWPRRIPPLLRALAIACLAVALARPQTVGGQTRTAARGVAIVALLDRSPSMETLDFPAGSATL